MLGFHRIALQPNDSLFKLVYSLFFIRLGHLISANVFRWTRAPGSITVLKAIGDLVQLPGLATGRRLARYRFLRGFSYGTGILASVGGGVHQNHRILGQNSQL